LETTCLESRPIELSSEDMKLYAIRTTVGQEKTSLRILEAKASIEGSDVYSIMVSDVLKGYILAEASDAESVEKICRGVPHVRGVLDGVVDLSEIEHLLVPRAATLDLNVGDIVELISGPFKGEKAKVVRVDEHKEEATLELLEASVPIPVTVPGSSLRIIEKEEREEES
jgi:transcriptional antiterminator NusG